VDVERVRGAVAARAHRPPPDPLPQRVLDVLGDQAAYLQEGMKVKLSVFEGRAVAIERGNRVVEV
jgi:hypothetical protein